ncbi:filamentous hemagglutinin N-terminal domain-containing protein [Anaerovibrio sp.]|uniref:filamentous hemagglutinin N-terminal domain-containing protein n=1 Tax=Anaerovibrio sp. TaxID=1872532 RepID=UPI003F13E478
MKLSRKLLTAAICLALGTGHAMAMPTGGSIVAGADNIKNFVENPASGAVIDFNGNGVINWNAFNIGTNEALTFNVAQNAMAFNYVSGGDISTILGHLTQSGKGSMVLCNPNGILVGNGAVINANDLTMMTMQLDNDQLKNIFTDAGSSILANVGSEGRIAIADGVYISSGADISSDDDGVHISSGADVWKENTASCAVSSFSLRSARGMVALADSNGDSAVGELPLDKLQEIISSNPSDGEMRAVIRQYLNEGYTVEEIMKQLDSLGISFLTRCRILTIILQSQPSLAEVTNQAKNMSALVEANNLSNGGNASIRTAGWVEKIDPNTSKLYLVEGTVTVISSENAGSSGNTGSSDNSRDVEQSVEQVELRAPDYIKNGFKLTSENTKKLGLASVADDKKLEQIVNEMKEMSNSPNTSSTSNTTTVASVEEGTDASSGNKEVGGALVVNGGTLSIGSEKTGASLTLIGASSNGDEKTGASLTLIGASSNGDEKTGASLTWTDASSIGDEKMIEPLGAGKITVSLGDEKIDTSLQSNLTVGSLTNRDRLFAD